MYNTNDRANDKVRKPTMAMARIKKTVLTSPNHGTLTAYISNGSHREFDSRLKSKGELHQQEMATPIMSFLSLVPRPHPASADSLGLIKIHSLLYA